MDLSKVISAISSETRRQILQIIADQPMKIEDVMTKLAQRGISLKYRESVYKAIEKLVNAGLVEKFYDKEEGICYKPLMRRIEIDLVEGTVKQIE